MKKTIAVLTVILIIVLCPALWLNTRTGVTLRDHFLFRRPSGEYKSHSGWSIICNESTGRFDAVLSNQTFSAALEWNDPVARFTFDDGEIIEGYWYGTGNLTDADTMPLFLNEDIYITIGDGNIRHSITKTDLADEFIRIYTGNTETFGSIGLVFLGVAIYVMGSVKFLFPEETHFLFSRWYYEKPILSDEGILFEKIGAVFIMLTGTAVMFAPLFV